MSGYFFQILKTQASYRLTNTTIRPQIEQKNIVYLLKSHLKFQLAILIALLSGYLGHCFGQSLGQNQPENQWVADTNAVLFKWNPSTNAVNYHLQVATDFGFTALVYNDSTLFNTNQLVNGLAPGTYFWRFKYYNGAVNSTWSGTRNFTLIDISGITDLSLWWNPHYGIVTADSAVSQWTDLSGNNNHGLQANNADRPILQNNVLNGYPILKFDGNTQYLKTLPFTLNSPNSIFLVYHKKIMGTDDFIFDGNVGDSYRLGLLSNSYLVYGGNFFSTSDAGPNGFKVINFRYNAGNSFLRNNFSFLTTFGNPGSTNPGGFTLGNYGTPLALPTFHANIDVAEVLIINDTVSLAQTNLIEQYLKFKFFPPVNLGPDLIDNYTLCATTLHTQGGYISHTWSTGASTDSLVVNNSGTYWVEVIDRMGLVSRDSIIINFNHPLPFSLEDSTICLGENLTWNSGLGAAGYNLLWSNSTTDSILNISTAGNYYYSVTDTNGCSIHSDTASISINNFPMASLGNDTSLCSGNWLSLNMPGGSGATYIWSTGSVDSITQVNLSGLYWVIATNPFGCIAEDSISVTIVGVAPVASFNVSSLCQGDSASFIDASTALDPITQWNWNFGDLIGTSSSQNPSYLFSNPGNYLVNLTTTTNVGCSDDTVISVTIMNRPDAAFGLVRNCDAGDAMFSDLSTSSFGPITNWFWDFGDPFSTNDTSILQNPTAFYPNSGIYPLQLRVENISGCKDTIIQNINILESGNAGFTVNKECAFNQLLFTNTSNITPPLGMAAYQWYFGTVANDSSQLIAPTFTYNSPGLYSVELISTATNGCKNIYKDTLDLNTYLIPDIALLTDTVCQNIPFNLLDNSLSQNTNINSWLWTINGDTVGNASNVPIIFSSSGLQSIGLVISSDSNCTGVITENVYVQAPPNASFVTNSAFGNIPFPTTFNFTGSGTISSYNWNFDDGFTGLDSLMVHTYQDSGVYNPFVIITDPFGCTDTATAQIEIKNPNYIFDIDISNLECIEENGFITINGNITNFSNFELTSMDMIGWVQESQPILEQWDGPLAIGGLYPYQSSYSVQSSEDANICCLRIGSITTQYFDTTVNIVACIPLNSYEFNVFSPYPNPTSGVTSINLIVPVDDNIELTITDAQGQTTISQSYAVTKGVNNISFDTINFASGVYTISVYYRTEAKFVRLLKI